MQIPTDLCLEGLLRDCSICTAYGTHQLPALLVLKRSLQLCAVTTTQEGLEPQ